jgi:hypothetical protein
MSENYRHPNPVVDVLRRVEPFSTLRHKWRAWRAVNIPKGSKQERSFQKQHAFRRQSSYDELLQSTIQHIVERNGLSVVAGPFQGLRYVEEAFCSGYTTKLLGCYEDELHDVVEGFIAAGCEAVIIIGAAEGWYANGLALRLPDARIIAFEMDEHARELCCSMTRLNGVSERVEVRGPCDINSLNKAFDDLSMIHPNRVLVICDCEGYEKEVMQPKRVPALRQCHLIIEMHECYVRGISRLIARRFRKTHALRLIESVYRDPKDVAECQFLPQAERDPAVDDRRGYWMQWAVLSPLSHDSPSHRTY